MLYNGIYTFPASTPPHTAPTYTLPSSLAGFIAIPPLSVSVKADPPTSGPSMGQKLLLTPRYKI